MTYYIATVFNDFYDSESGFDGTFIGTGDEVARQVNKVGEELCEEYDIPTTPHNYGDEVNGEYEGSVFQPIFPNETYGTHLLFEDAMSNRVYVRVKKLNVKNDIVLSE